MPIYEYECKSCGDLQEVMQSVGASAPPSCEKCQASGTLEKKMSRTGFILKGAGWYVTDFRGGSQKTPPASDGAADKENNKENSKAAKDSGDKPKKAESAAKDPAPATPSKTESSGKPTSTGGNPA